MGATRFLCKGNDFCMALAGMPGVWVERQSTQTELRCVAHGGPNGGHVRFAILGEGKLERVYGHVLPVEQDVSPGKKLDFTITYQGKLPSSTAENIRAVCGRLEKQEVGIAQMDALRNGRQASVSSICMQGNLV